MYKWLLAAKLPKGYHQRANLLVQVTVCKSIFGARYLKWRQLATGTLFPSEAAERFKKWGIRVSATGGKRGANFFS
jgi:hypothetical protein